MQASSSCSVLLAAALLSSLSLAAPCDTGNGASTPGKFSAFVPFGDSYTDIDAHTDGGTMWPVYVAGEAGIDLHSFAVSGATCSSTLTPREFTPVIEGQLPKYLNASLNLDPATTVYSLWIGTNDVGQGLLLDGGQAKGVTIVDVARCGADWVEQLYDSGARNFVSMNMVPLDYAPAYTRPNKNMELLRELIAAGNELRENMLQILAPTLSDAHIGLFDTHSLFMDIINNPHNYLNGTVDPNTTSTIDDCKNDGCSNDSDKDSYLWNNDLHPSEQVDRIVAREMAAVVSGGESQWFHWIS